MNEKTVTKIFTTLIVFFPALLLAGAAFSNIVIMLIGAGGFILTFWVALQSIK
jgi:hypothetical protein